VLECETGSLRHRNATGCHPVLRETACPFRSLTSILSSSQLFRLRSSCDQPVIWDIVIWIVDIVDIQLRAKSMEPYGFDYHTIQRAVDGLPDIRALPTAPFTLGGQLLHTRCPYYLTCLYIFTFIHISRPVPHLDFARKRLINSISTT
jgi:hypothetical protein